MVDVRLHELKGDLSLNQALDHLSDFGGSAVVADGSIIEVDNLLQALRTAAGQKVTLGQVTRSTYPGVTIGAPEASPDGKTRVLVSGLESVDATILRTSVTLCRCTAYESHVWRPDELAVSGRCNLDGSPVICR